MRSVTGILFVFGAGLAFGIVGAAQTRAVAPGAPEIHQPTAPGSPTYLMERLCISSSGGSSGSTSYQTVVVLADGAVQGLSASCSSGMQAAIGLCSLARDVSAPIVLTLDRMPADPGSVELIWSGAEPTYEAFRSVSSVGVVHPVNSFAVTSGCSLGDPTAGEDPLVFYRVDTPSP